MTTIRLIGPGRAGRALAAAFADVGYDVPGVVAHGVDLSSAAEGVDALVLAVPDRSVAAVAALVRPCPTTVVLHLAGSLGLDVLAPHRRRASFHPLVPLPAGDDVARIRLRSGAMFAVAGDPFAVELVRGLGGHPVTVADDQRAAYHAAACIAANHVVGLLGQVERVAARAGLGLDIFVGLAAAAVSDVARLGPAAALTGPAARGDMATLARHRAAIDPSEHAAYDAGAALACRLAGQAANSVLIDSDTTCTEEPTACA